MPHVYIEDIAQHIGQEVTLKGWLYNKTDKGKLSFLLVRDGTGILQAVVFKKNITPAVSETTNALTQESSILVTGKIRQENRAIGGFEMDVTHLEIEQIAESYPITPKDHGISFLMDNRHLWLRSSRQYQIMRIRSEIVKACQDFLNTRGFTLVDTPIITPTACEGTTTLFELDYFEEKAYLTQSGQLYNEAACMSVGKTYCFGPTFRAEKSKTRRHLTEFWMIEPEVAYADLDDIMNLAEQYIVYIVQRVLNEKSKELEALGRDLSLLNKVQLPFPRISYSDAFDILEEEGSETMRGSDFGGADETLISERFDRPLIVHRYPQAIKAFYMEPDPTDPKLALCMDILAPEGYGEIVGGSQRIHSHDLLLTRIKEHNLPIEPFQWYLDLRKYGSVPHSGFGMGIERLVAWICGIEHVRETIAFPRMLHRMYP
ncbi:MAG: asparagine--tRNA ligase [Acidobacteriota bacterium]|nr:asparagine--tRNA ligase [Acidobacteriota bacterium]